VHGEECECGNVVLLVQDNENEKEVGVGVDVSYNQVHKLNEGEGDIGSVHKEKEQEGGSI